MLELKSNARIRRCNLPIPNKFYIFYDLISQYYAAGLDFSLYCTGHTAGYYLHNDGVWRHSTHDENGEYTGYFPSMEVATEFLETIWPGKNIQIIRESLENCNEKASSNI